MNASVRASGDCRRRRSGCIVLARAASLALLATALLPLPSLAADYWGCDSPAHRFEIKNNAVRCYKEGAKQSFPPAHCVAPATRVVDHRDKVDACVSGPIAGDLVCLEPGTRIEISAGEDRCIKYGAPDIRAPDQRVSR